jgi:hypothetical protein
MITEIFSDEERKILESHLISAKVDKIKIDKLLDKIKTQQRLFDDVFLYLQVKKTLS